MYIAEFHNNYAWKQTLNATGTLGMDSDMQASLAKPRVVIAYLKPCFSIVIPALRGNNIISLISRSRTPPFSNSDADLSVPGIPTPVNA